MFYVCVEDKCVPHILEIKNIINIINMNKFYITLLLFCCLSLSSLYAEGDYTLYGKITCSGVGVPDVVVSDGYNFTQTDESGYYYLNSDKKNGYVFYVIPSGYMPYTGASSETADKIFPPFWQAVNYPNTPTKVEKHDFKLKVENNENHIMFFQADPQVGNRSDNNDYNQYITSYFPRTKQEIAAAGSTPIYTTVLGDLSWDYYWYYKSYDIASYRGTLINNYYSFKMRHFSVMGNHDHDGATPEGSDTDFASSSRFRQIMGPNCYSYNIGKLHYIVLDDIIYKNTYTEGASYVKGIVGDRDYTQAFADDQLAWLEKDLSYVSKDATIMLSVHCPLWGINTSFNPYAFLSNNTTQKACNLLKDFKAVHIFSGHRHNTYNIEPSNYGFNNMYEHTLGAVGGNLWWSGYYSGHPNCNDGTPGGWQIFYINGDTITWQFHDLENNGNAQFRVVDGNTLREFYKNNTTLQEIRKAYTTRQDYSTLEDNVVLVNVFNYDPKWQVQMFEGSKELTVTRWRCEDVYHTMTYDIPRFEDKGQYTTDNATNWNLHTFKAIASSSNSSITVKVTDRFGNVYQKTVTRPIPCTIEALAAGNEEMILTGVQKRMNALGQTSVYSHNGKIYVNSDVEGEVKITNVNGMSRIHKLNVGQNTYPVTKGIYIVTVNDENTKLYVK